MSNRVRLMLVLNFLLYLKDIEAQYTIPNRLFIGDTIPNVTLSLTNFTSSSVKISDFKNRLLIFDFWNSFCSSCISSMPELEKMQKEFSDKVQIILVTTDSDEQLKKLRKVSKIFRDCDLPMVESDTILYKYFPFKTVPSHVWIDSERVVKQITSGRNTSSIRIKDFFLGKSINLMEKKEDIDFNDTVPLWTEGNGRQRKHLQYYSHIMNHITSSNRAGYGGGDSTEIRTMNLPIIDLYQYAFGGLTIRGCKFGLKSRCIIQAKDSSDFFEPKDISKYEEWVDKNTYSYELKVPSTRSSEKLMFMQQDLDRFFGMHGYIENRKILCLVLEKIKKKRQAKCDSQIESHGKEDSFDVDNLDVFVNTLEQINSIKGGRPIINETGSSKIKTITVHARLDRIGDVNDELLQYGLRLNLRYRRIDMLIIRGTD
ncbi:MAG: redoxin family protein [Bacteroidota bacterium]